MGAFDVFGLGQCTFDRMGIVPSLPPPDEKREIEGEHEQVGGPIATARAVDTTGCGAIFHAGLVEAFLSGWPWGKCFDFAAWAAARAAERLGNRAPGREGYPEAR
jgi:sugar/nucleoside kinase (ribokinase family)